MTEKVLIVDDSGANRLLLGSILKKSGYDITEAVDGQQALERAFDAPPDLILLDIMMPGMDGYEVCAILKKDGRTEDIPIIFLSAKSETADKIKGLEMGGADYVTKPFDKGEVLARVRSQLKIRSLNQRIIQNNKELLEKQRRLEEDLKAAAGIQKSLLPAKVPSIQNVSVVWRFQPCDLIGGDIFNVCRLDQDSMGIYMIDVSGHGVPASLVTVSVSQMLHPESGYLKRIRSDSSGVEIVSPAEVLVALDREYPLERFDKFFTIVYMVLDTHRELLRYCSAAHPPPVLLRTGGGLELLDKAGTIIGLGGVVPFEEEEIRLAAGDKLILYTDGVLECQNEQGDFYGESRFHSLLQELRDHSVDQILDGVLDSLTAFAGGLSFQDDVSLLGVEFKKSHE
ncbi:MAG TPA: SpoIIE family protein phosphatase [Syntrophobacteraceae bacterium]|nr:SpoIIE family protein phosphatase [Syntrophobacteraceae bacterium]